MATATATKPTTDAPAGPIREGGARCFIKRALIAPPRQPVHRTMPPGNELYKHTPDHYVRRLRDGTFETVTGWSVLADADGAVGVRVYDRLDDLSCELDRVEQALGWGRLTVFDLGELLHRRDALRRRLGLRPEEYLPRRAFFGEPDRGHMTPEECETARALCGLPSKATGVGYVTKACVAVLRGTPVAYSFRDLGKLAEVEDEEQALAIAVRMAAGEPPPWHEPLVFAGRLLLGPNGATVVGDDGKALNLATVVGAAWRLVPDGGGEVDCGAVVLTIADREDAGGR